MGDRMSKLLYNNASTEFHYVLANRFNHTLPFNIECFDDTGATQAAALRRAFDFLRTQGNRKYTDRSLMSLARAADRIDGGIARQYEPVPVLLTAPYSYDELTEIKSGGTIACMVFVPVDSDSRDAAKFMLAVRNNNRRKGIAAGLIEGMRYVVIGSVCTYVHQNNTPGVALLATAGMTPAAIDQFGVLRFQTSPNVADVEAMA